jgi:hypothetical protein
MAGKGIAPNLEPRLRGFSPFGFSHSNLQAAEAEQREGP